ncbi:uncharacterized protein LOC129913576 [Episyrphus balteatus]|uniref:uncharacterized protein LOC129909742 n=1 Tax=Episyrphus balteatus TaxID=286459 RepID=UPI00248603A6|nr:uncharacterized protein LOC129909742 [Episyrphus balteatus]XP_055848273.1 uncharacterized protein LOC129913560 [Episyrphus balteatus]XP_055848299.1 uncharacterized protein LOC129913576 [Episyrphus balteatus]
MDMNIKTLKNLIKTKEALKKKYMLLKTGKYIKDLETENTYKPIVEPLRKIVKNFENSETKNRELKEIKSSAVKRRLQFKSPPTEEAEAIEYENNSSEGDLNLPLSNSMTVDEDTSFKTPSNSFNESTPINRSLISNSLHDKIYGPYFDAESNSNKLGRSNFKINDENNIIIDEEIFYGTEGLLELVLSKNPRKSIYNTEDLKQYQKILQKTCAHLRNHDINSQVKGNRGQKYKKIIKPLIQSITKSKQTKVGNAYMDMDSSPTMIYSANPIDYVYWDNPNELVDRLRLLIASETSGHNNHKNEINSIVEELREQNIIY